MGAGNFIFFVAAKSSFFRIFHFFEFQFHEKNATQKKTAHGQSQYLRRHLGKYPKFFQKRYMVFTNEDNNFPTAEFFSPKSRNLWCQNQRFFHSDLWKLCEDCCFKKESKNHKKSKGKKRKNLSTQNMAKDNIENLEENSSKKKRK